MSQRPEYSVLLPGMNAWFYPAFSAMPKKPNPDRKDVDGISQ
jgi:hypothetical protein